MLPGSAWLAKAHARSRQPADPRHGADAEIEAACMQDRMLTAAIPGPAPMGAGRSRRDSVGGSARSSRGIRLKQIVSYPNPDAR